MTISDWHILFKLGMDKAGGTALPYLEPEAIDYIFNYAIKAVYKQKITGLNALRQGAEESGIRRVDLQTMIAQSIVPSASFVTNTSNKPYGVFVATPTDMFYLLDEEVCISSDTCSPTITNGTLEEGEMYKVVISTPVTPVGSGLTLNITASAGVITAVNATPTAGGTVYKTGDYVMVTGGTAIVKVVTAHPTTGVVSAVSLIYGGTSGYTTGTGVATTVTQNIIYNNTVYGNGTVFTGIKGYASYLLSTVATNTKIIQAKRVNVLPIRNDQYNTLILDPFNRPDENKILKLDYGLISTILYFELISSKGIDINQYYIRYYKNPASVKYGAAYSSVVSNVECDLPSIIHEEIIDFAVNWTLESIESPRFQSQLANLNRNE